MGRSELPPHPVCRATFAAGAIRSLFVLRWLYHESASGSLRRGGRAVDLYLERSAAAQRTWRAGPRHRSETLRLERRQVGEGDHFRGTRYSRILGNPRVFEYRLALGGGPLRLTSRRVLRIEFNQTFADGENGGLRPVVNLQFVKNVSHMILDGLFTKIQVIGNFFIGFAVGHQAQHGNLPLREIVPGPRRLLTFAFREEGKLREDLAGHGRMDQRFAFGDGPDGRDNLRRV